MAVLDAQEAQLRADVKAQQAALDLARINLGYTHITAPVGGEVSERDVRTGQYVHAGTQVIAVVPLDTLSNDLEAVGADLTFGQPRGRFEAKWLLRPSASIGGPRSPYVRDDGDLRLLKPVRSAMLTA
jgi:multidrug efflux pump subunit AcrA (membrane-fusion protein)